MADYRAALGHDIALVSLTVLNPQPTSGGIIPTQRTYGISGKAHEMAPHAILEWSMVKDATQYDTILDFFGLAAALNAPVTVYLRNHLFVYARYNATAYRPLIGTDAAWANYWLRNVRVVLTNLVAI